MSIPTHLTPGEGAENTRTITAADVAAFADLSGDHDPIHVDPDHAARTAFGGVIAHGALVMGLLSACASAISQRSVARGSPGTPVSAGYDRVRFTRPVRAGDTLTARYVIEAVDDARGRTRAAVTITNAAGETVLTGTHLLSWVVSVR